MKQIKAEPLINYSVEIEAAIKLGNKLLERLKVGETPTNIMATKVDFDATVKVIPQPYRLQNAALLSIIWRYTQLLSYYREYFKEQGAQLDTLIHNRNKQLQKSKKLN